VNAIFNANNNPLPCGCGIKGTWDTNAEVTESVYRDCHIVFCALHKAAPLLREALTRMLNNLPVSEIEIAREAWGSSNTRCVLDARELAEAALKAARGEAQ